MKKTVKTIVRAISLTLAAMMIVAAFAGCTRVLNTKICGDWYRYEISYGEISNTKELHIDREGNCIIGSADRCSEALSYHGKCFAIGNLLYIKAEAMDDIFMDGETVRSLYIAKVIDNQLVFTYVKGDKIFNIISTVFSTEKAIGA